MGAQANHRREDVVLSLAKETLRSFGEFRFVAWGSSMLPSVFPGDTLIVRHETAETAPVGVIVLLARQGRLYAHRLVDKTQESGQLRLIVRGDALSSDDPPFAEDEVLGRVTAVIRRGRRIDLDGKNPRCDRAPASVDVRRPKAARNGCCGGIRCAHGSRRRQPPLATIFDGRPRDGHERSSPRVARSQKSGSTIEIGGIPIFLRTHDEDFRRLIEDRYAGFVNDFAEPSCQLEILLHPPAGRMPGDVRVSKSGSLWRIERGDFCAEFDARSRRGWVRQSANPYSLDAVMRIIHSLVLAEEGGFLLHAASGVRNGPRVRVRGRLGSGQDDDVAACASGCHLAYRRDFLHPEKRERLPCLWHSFRGGIGARGNEREGTA